ncbi:MAG: 2'-5' RNA ligase [Rhodocyclales bacterium RIFCSPLOWO2_02_FULL_63_24]|nr:MAG: 2'-5' RNA ligase [Rhodocyclales bacterium GWA2_65_19]OHC71472.1 MAG: 2'-5' RNA ligase [Rhodocyclales bacterium RIFCSPLOWO2_02_FULL_63_24]
MAEAHSRRVFFALWPDDEAVGHLSALAHHLATGGGRLMRPASLHLTLAFVGSVTPSQVDQLEAIAAGVRAEAFDLSLDRLGFWPQRGILWAGCRQTPAPLRSLAGLLAGELRAAGFAVEQRSGSALAPHVTLARRVRCTSMPRLETPIGWRVGEFALVETHLHPSAASYQTLASFPLDAADPG